MMVDFRVSLVFVVFGVLVFARFPFDSGSTVDGQDLARFSQVVDRWKTVSETPYYGEYLIEVDSTGSVSAPAKKSSEQIFIGNGGFLIIRTRQSENSNAVLGLNKAYGFTLKYIGNMTPELIDFADMSDESDWGGGQSGLTNIFLDKYRKLRVHPALYLLDGVSWLDVVRSPGFSVSSFGPIEGRPGFYEVHFACAPTESELTRSAGIVVPVLKNGVLEISANTADSLPTRYAVEYSVKTGGEIGKVERINEFEEMENGEWRLKKMQKKRDYSGRKDEETQIFQNVTTKPPKVQEFCLSRFGLPEPTGLKRTRPKIYVWLGCGIAFVVVVIGFWRFQHRKSK